MSRYYNVNNILSHDCLFNFIITGRGYGKTYGFTKWCIKRYIKTKEQFVYARRQKNELENVNIFFNALEKDEEFANYEFTVAGMTGYIREKSDEEVNTNTWEIICYFVNLSTQASFKSTPFPDVTTIIFDEFIIDTTSGKQNYLKNEPRLLLEMYSTIARPGSNHPKVRLFCLGNNLSIVNPYFTYFNIKITKQYGLFKARDNKLLVHLAKTSEEFKTSVQQTDFYKIIADTEYADYSIDNTSLTDNTNMIRKRSGNYRGWFNVVINDILLGIWYNIDEDYLYIDKTKVPEDASEVTKTYNINFENSNPAWNRVGSLKRSYWSKMVKDYYLTNNVFYSDLEVQFLFQEAYKEF